VNLSHRRALRGFCPRHALEQQIQFADLRVLQSEREGIGFVVDAVRAWLGQVGAGEQDPHRLAQRPDVGLLGVGGVGRVAHLGRHIVHWFDSAPVPGDRRLVGVEDQAEVAHQVLAGVLEEVVGFDVAVVGALRGQFGERCGEAATRRHDGLYRCVCAERLAHGSHESHRIPADRSLARVIVDD
jgi:hypothetical protein